MVVVAGGVIVLGHVQGGLEDVGLEHAALGVAEHVGVWQPTCATEERSAMGQGQLQLQLQLREFASSS